VKAYPDKTKMQLKTYYQNRIKEENIQHKWTTYEEASLQLHVLAFGTNWKFI